MYAHISWWKTLLLVVNFLVLGHITTNAWAAEFTIDFSTNGPLGNLASPDLVDPTTGLQVHGLYLPDGFWLPANLYRRNQTNDRGLGVCNPAEAEANGGDCPGPSGGGNVNELDDQGQRELIVLELPDGFEWVSVGISSLDTNGNGPIPERGQLYADGDGVPNSNDPNDAGDSVIRQFEGGTDPIEFVIDIPASNASSRFLIFEPADWVEDSVEDSTDNDYLVMQATVREVPPVAQLGDRVWEDMNVNGVQDCEDTNKNGIIGDAGDTGPECDAGIPGVQVNLLAGDCQTPLGQTVMTDMNGFYLFPNLDPGDYCVEFGKPLPEFCDTEGFVLGMPQFTTQNAGNDALDSDADTGTGVSDPINLAAGETDLTVDAGIYCPAKIGDRVWSDDNKDGLQDSSEKGVPGVVVNLYECTDGQAVVDQNRLVRTTTTDDAVGDMNYMFGAEPGFDLVPGEYFVQFMKPGDSQFTTLEQGPDGTLDSDCLPDGTSSCVTLGSRGINLNRDCGLIPPPPPECDLQLDKQCRVETPPVSGDLECEAKIAASVLEYTGPGTPSAITVTGKNKKSPVVSNFNAATGILTVDARPGDLGSKMTITTDGVAEVIHTSCSAPYVAGQPAPLDKPKGDPSSNWLVLSFVDKNGGSASLPNGGDEGLFTDDCTVTKPPQPSCDTVGKPNTLTFKYTGGGCPGDNSQGKKANCSGTIDGTATVTISVNTGDNYTVSPTVVAPGDTFTVTRSSQDFKSNTDIDLSNAGGTQENEVHTSCSAPLAVGDEFGAITLVGINGQTGGVDVTYRYVVTNNGDPLSNVLVTDNLLGDIDTILELGTGASDSLTRTVRISGTTVNIGSAVGLLSDGTQCPASDSTTVTVVEPPPPVGGGECDGKVTDLVMKNLGADAQVRVDQKKDGTVFDDFVPTGGEFSFSGTDKKGTLGTEISIFVNDSLDTKIHTSCSQPIGPGLVSGSFEVISGNSRNGGPLPPLIGMSGAIVNDASGAQVNDATSAGAMSWMMFLGLGVIGLWRLNRRTIRSN